ncbi:MAG: ABC transporter substrate-binding protein, partial [Candidatus Cloacimonetes bacterium]|nr:ABC transporter substrate-binding protein [Candidatus Cloacimonadota bacterium]
TSNQSNNQKQKKITIINLIDNQLLEDAEKGVFTQLEKNGLKKDIHYTIKRYNAQGDISQLQQIIDLVKQSKPDIILTITTPALLATTAKIKDIPIVFTVASNPKTLNINQENIYGVYDNPAMDKMLAVAQDMISNLKIVGTIYDSSQLNSIIAVEKLRKACKEKNIKLLEMTITSTIEISLATQSIIQKGAQALILSSDNQINTGFPSVLNVTLPHNIPVIVSEISLTDVGASAAIGISYYEWGEQSGIILAKILLNQQINEPHCFEQNNLKTIIRK